MRSPKVSPPVIRYLPFIACETAPEERWSLLSWPKPGEERSDHHAREQNREEPAPRRHCELHEKEAERCGCHVRKNKGQRGNRDDDRNDRFSIVLVVCRYRFFVGHARSFVF